MPKQKVSQKKKPSKNSKPKKRAIELPVEQTETVNQLSGGPTILVRGLETIKSNWATFSLILVVYFVISLIIVRGLSSSIDIGDLRQIFHNGQTANGLATGLTLIFGNSTSENGSFSQPIILVVASLIMIWAIREAVNKHKVSLRDSLYKSLSPLIPFTLIFLLMAVDLIPLILASYFINLLFINGLINNLAVEIIITLALCGLILFSIYLLIPTIISIYIVALPDMRPVQAIRSAWRLVKKKRALLFRKIAFILLAILLINIILTLLFILVFSSVSGLIYFGISIICVLIFHSYMYNLYRGLL